MGKKYIYLDTATGRQEADDGPVSAGGRYAVKASNQSTSSTTLADITDLSIAVAAGQAYHVRGVLNYTASASGEGHTISLVTPSSPTLVNIAGQSFSGGSGANQVSFPIVANGGTLVQTVSNGATRRSITLDGIFINGSNSGTLKLQFATETASTGTTTVEAGSFLMLTPITAA